MKKLRETEDYDDLDTTSLIDPKRRFTLENLGFKLPATPPSQVVSIRLPTRLLNQIRSKASAMDIPYQAFIKMALNRVIRHP